MNHWVGCLELTLISHGLFCILRCHSFKLVQIGSNIISASASKVDQYNTKVASNPTMQHEGRIKHRTLVRNARWFAIAQILWSLQSTPSFSHVHLSANRIMSRQCLCDQAASLSTQACRNSYLCPPSNYVFHLQTSRRRGRGEISDRVARLTDNGAWRHWLLKLSPLPIDAMKKKKRAHGPFPPTKCLRPQDDLTQRGPFLD